MKRSFSWLFLFSFIHTLAPAQPCQTGKLDPRVALAYFLTKAFCQYAIRVYAPDPAMETPELAPIQRKNVAGLPPALIITAEFDPLRDEGYAYAERLKKAGVPTVPVLCPTNPLPVGSSRWCP